MKVKRVIFVKANWCPHCKISESYVRMIAEELNAAILELDIDNKDQERIADDIVKNYGDWSPNYLIPQVFIEFEDGSIKHILTGDPNGIDYTLKKWKDFIGGSFYKSLKSFSA